MPQALKLLEAAAQQGLLSDEQKSELDAYKKREAYGRLKKAQARGELDAATSAKLDALDPKGFESKGSGLAAYLQGLYSELTLGYGDELASGLESLVTGKPYDQSLTEHRARDATAEVARPDAHFAGQITGGAASALAPGAAALRVTKGAGLARQAVAGAGAGTVTEGARAYGQGTDGMANRMADVPTGAAIGMTGGAVAPVAGRVLGSAARGVTRAVNRGRVPGASKRSTETLLDVFQRDAAATGRSARDLPAAVREMGDDATLADLGGEFRTAAAKAVEFAGPEKTRLPALMAARMAGQGKRINTALDDAMGRPGLGRYAQSSLAAERKALGKEYDAILSGNGPIDAADLVKALRAAAKTAGPDTRVTLGKYIGALNAFRRKAKDAVDGKKTTTMVPAEALHNIRSDLSDAAREATIAGHGKRAKRLKDFLDAIDDRLDTVPGYKDVRAKYAVNMARGDAIDLGATALAGGKKRADPGALATLLGQMAKDPERRDLFRAGMREGVERLSGQSKKGPQSVLDTLKSSWNRDAVMQALGPDGSRLLARLDRERAFGETADAVARAARASARHNVAERLSPGSSALERSTPGIFSSNIAYRIASGIRGLRGPRPGGTMRRAGEVAEILGAQGGTRDRALAALLKRLNARERAALLARIGYGTGALGAHAVGSAANIGG